MSCLDHQPDPEENEFILMAQLSNTRNLSNLLKAIHFKEVNNSIIPVYLIDKNTCQSISISSINKLILEIDDQIDQSINQ
jgi:hypothetical protein